MDTIEIRNDQLRARIDSKGAELQSLTCISSGEEYIWQRDPQVWSGSAPVLFPIVGALRDNQMLHAGKTYAMAKHGLARNARFDTVAQGPGSALFSLRSSSETLAHYPWQFRLDVRFSLERNALAVDYQVRNDDAQTMIYTIGSHPAFRLPLAEHRLPDYRVEFERAETLERFFIDDAGLLSSEGAPCLDNQRTINLSETLFEQDALVFKDIASRRISLLAGSATRRLTIDTGGAPHLGIWAKPAAPFVCLEPWYGYSDPADASGQFADKPSMQRLHPGEEFHTGLRIEIHAAN